MKINVLKVFLTEEIKFRNLRLIFSNRRVESNEKNVNTIYTSFYLG
jgi:hypothetical protein